jgi:hypothetical protein
MQRKLVHMAVGQQKGRAADWRPQKGATDGLEGGFGRTVWCNGETIR